MELEKLFVVILNNSITATWVIAAVCLLRLLLRRCPRRYVCLLWTLPALRLVFPFSLESALSLIPSAKTVSTAILTAPQPAIDSLIYIVDSLVNETLLRTAAPRAVVSANPMQIAMFAAGVVWLAGICVLLLYMLISHIRLSIRLRDAVYAAPGIWMSENICSPFVIGIFAPRIFLPYSVDSAAAGFVLAHERMHLRRRDNYTKPLAFILLSVYWFNPAVWLAYFLFSRDIELACDEAVISDFTAKERKDYSLALLNCAVHTNLLLSPLAFGEACIKERIKSVLNFKKPTFLVSAAALCVCVIAAVCLLTNPLSNDNSSAAPSVTASASTPAPTGISSAVDEALPSVEPAPVATKKRSISDEEFMLAAQNAQAEVNRLYELGILSEEPMLDFDEPEMLDIDGNDVHIISVSEHKSGLNGRTLDDGYTISAYNKAKDARYYFSISKKTGKIYYFSAEMSYAEGDTMLDREPLDMGKGPRAFYDSFYRVMSDDMTLDGLCSLLCEYWGFSGYTLSGTRDAFYGYDTDTPSGGTLVKDTQGAPYITVYFDGDEEGMPMYIENVIFPERTYFGFGTGHSVG